MTGTTIPLVHNNKHCEHPIIITAGRSQDSLTAHLITLFLAREYPLQQFILLSSFVLENDQGNDILFLDAEGIGSLGQLIDWQLLKGKVSYRNLKGYSVNFLMEKERESTIINERKAVIKVGDLKRAISDFLVQNCPNVKLELDCFDEQIGFKTVQDQRLPTIKYISKEEKQEEVLAQMIIDCERKSFVLRSLLSNFNTSFTISQSPSNYASINLNIPFDVLNPLMSNDEIHVFQSDEVVLVSVPTSDQNFSFTSTAFFKISDIQTQTSILSKFFNQEFPSSYPLISDYISNQVANQRAEIIYNYKIGSPCIGNILFIDSSEMPLFGDQKLQNCFAFIQLVRDDIAKFGVSKADTQLLKTTLSLNNQQEEDVKFIETKFQKFRDAKNSSLKSKRSIVRFCWDVVKMPFKAMGNHLLEVFGFKKSELSIGQKWMFRIFYVITTLVIKEKISSYLSERAFCISLEQKVGTNKLFSDLIRKGVYKNWDTTDFKKIIWKSNELLTFAQIEAIIGLLRYSTDRKDFIDVLISSGNIQKLSAIHLSQILKKVGAITNSEKLDLLERIKPYLEILSEKDVQYLLQLFTLSHEKEIATKILQGIEK